MTLQAELNPFMPQGNSKMAARSIVVREGNEGGFYDFLQTLQGVFWFLLTPENGNLATDALVEAGHHLLDARDSLSLLIVELERGDPNPTGLSTSTLQAPLQNLDRFVAQVMSIEQAETFDQGIAYSTSVTTTQFGPGRKRYDISRDQLEHLSSLFFLLAKIADMLQVSVSTTQRRRREFGQSDEFE